MPTKHPQCQRIHDSFWVLKQNKTAINFQTNQQTNKPTNKPTNQQIIKQRKYAARVLCLPLERAATPPPDHLEQVQESGIGYHYV